MPLNTVVVVGDRFDPAMFKMDQFFDGGMDPGATIIGPIAQVTYGSGRCAFELNPNRIDVKVQSEEIMPDELRSAANVLIETVEGIRAAKAVSTTGIGLNCDFSLQVSLRTGNEISNDLVKMDALKDLTKATPQATMIASRYVRGEMTYTIRVEPEAQSNGQNLYLAVNGHQNVAPSDSLETKLNQFAEFREYVEALHDRVTNQILV